MTTPPIPDTDPLDALTGIASSHPLWSTTDAGDIPRLLARIDELEAMVKEHSTTAAKLNATLQEAYSHVQAIEPLHAIASRRRIKAMRLIMTAVMMCGTLDQNAATAYLEGDGDGVERLRAAVEGKE